MWPLGVTSSFWPPRRLHSQNCRPLFQYAGIVRRSAKRGATAAERRPDAGPASATLARRRGDARPRPPAGVATDVCLVRKRIVFLRNVNGPKIIDVPRFLVFSVIHKRQHDCIYIICVSVTRYIHWTESILWIATWIKVINKCPR